MTPEAQRIAIAEACGWNHRLATRDNPVCRDGMTLPNFFGPAIEAFWKDGTPGVFVDVPDYLNDLNAMHEAEKQFVGSRESTYWQHLTQILFKQTAKPQTYEFALLHATARQRAEAFLRTIRKWEE